MRRAGLALAVAALAAVPTAAQKPVPSHTSATPARTPAARTEARVNGVAVTSDRVTAALARLIPQQSFHRNISPEKLAELRTQALGSAIDEELAYQDGVRRGLTASDADLKAAWTATVAKTGGQKVFDDVLRQSHTSEADVRHELTRRIIIDKAGGRAVEHCAATVDDARRYFAQYPDRFVEPEQLHIYAVTVGVDPSSPQSAWQEAKRKADEARKALDAGTPFAEVARTYSTDPSRDKGGDMGLVHKGALASPFDKLAESLQVGKTSGVVQSLYGYHIVLLSEIRPPERKTFEQVSDTLLQDLSSSRCSDQRAAWMAALHAAAHIEMTEPAP